MRKLLGTLILSSSLASGWSITSINSSNKFAFGANVGWLDARGDTNNGAVIGEYVCSGSLYAANLGWVSLGSGAPTNGIQYQNLSAGDFGVNQDGLGNLRGYAYGANVGWINFENSGAPKVDLLTGRMSGAVYAANCGWISLSNAVTVVQTDTIPGGTDSNTNGLPDAWERLYFGGLGVNPNADPDGDKVSNRNEYLAGTNPNDPNDRLAITSYTISPGGTSVNLTWKTVATRFYYLQKEAGLESTSWVDSGLGLILPAGATTTRSFSDTNSPRRFYRVRAVRPLAP